MDKIIINEKAHTDLLTSDFYYDLPEELIAQTPLEPRDSSRLMVISPKMKMYCLILSYWGDSYKVKNATFCEK